MLLGIENKREIDRFMKGAFRNRPTFPRYNETWEPYPVLLYLEKLEPLDTLTLGDLTIKIVLLLALTSAQRVQTLSKIKISNIIHFEDRIEIQIPDLIKTSAPNKTQPKIILPYFEKKALCISTILLHYLDITRSLRGNIDQVLITIKKPHHPATQQNISRWIKRKKKRLTNE